MTKEALKQALEAMAADKQHWNEDEWRRNNWRCGHGWLRGEQCEICNAEQEPVAHWSDCAVHSEPAYPKGECDCGGLATPPQRTWVGLTDEENT